MKRNTRSVITALALAASFVCATSAYAQITVIIQQPPPNQLKVESLWNITITNSSTNTYEVYLLGKVTEEREGLLFEASTTRFSLKPGLTRLNLQMISPIKVNYTNKKYQDVIIKTGSVPEGIYDYCINVIDITNDKEIGQGCLTTLQYVRNPIQITLISPFNGQVVEEEYPNFAVILQPDHTPTPPRLPDDDKEYKIVEIIGNQSPIDAINSNPAWFVINTKLNVIKYPISARKFENGKKYAWQVKVFDENKIEVGVSDVGFFEYHSLFDPGRRALLRQSVMETEVIEYSRNTITPRIFSPPSNVPDSRLPTGRNSFYFLDDSKENSFPVKLSGNTKLYAQTSDRQGMNSEIPKNFWRWDLNTTLSIYDIPIGFDAFISSEQKDIRQNINMFRFQFSPQQLIKSEAEKLKESFISNFLSMFSNIGIGTCYPNYSPLTLSSIPVSGVDIEFTPGIFYLAFTAGRSQKEIQGDLFRNPTYERRITAGKIGIGQKQTSHFHLTFMHSLDDASSISPDTFSVSPQENYLIAAETEISLFNKLFNLKGELVGSLLTRDTRSAELITDKIPNWVKKAVKPKISSSVDYAYSIATVLNLPTSTRLSGYYKTVGPGFYSHGVPYLRNDVQAYEVKADQSFFNRSLSFGGYYRNDRDNLIPWKRVTTTVSSYGLNLGLRFRDLPFVQFNYSPFFQKNDIDSGKVDNTMRLFSFITGYSYKIGNLNSSTNFFFSYQESKTLRASSNFNSKNYSINETISFEFPLVFSLTLSLFKANYSFATSDIISFDLNASYTAFDEWQNSLGFNLSNDKNVDRKFGFYLSTSFPIWKIATMDIRAEKNFYRDDLVSNNNFNELIIRGTLSRSW